MKQKISLTIDTQTWDRVKCVVKRTGFRNASELASRLIEKGIWKEKEIYREKAKHHARMLKVYQDLIEIETEREKERISLIN